MSRSSKRTKATDWQELERLFILYLQDDPQASRHLFGELLQILRGYFFIRMGKSPDLEDLLQATLLKIHFARDRYDSALKLKTWVFTIASRSLIDHWRGGAKEWETLALANDSENNGPVLEEDSLPSQDLDPERKWELTHDLTRALNQLKPMERSIVYLYGVEGLSMAEIGQALSLTESATKLRAHRAYQELRKNLVGFFWVGLIEGIMRGNLWTS